MIDDPQQQAKLLQTLSQLSKPFVLIHGGGNLASEVSVQLGISPQMINGRRVTGEKDLRVAVMVYAGWLNKSLVAGLQARGSNAIGLSGADAGLLLARRRHVTPAGIDFGFVGDILEVRIEGLIKLMKIGLNPVVCAITHDGMGQLLNTNADTIATEIAAAFAKTQTDIEFFNCLDLPGVMGDIADPDSLMQSLTYAEYQELKQKGKIHSGMLPKLDTAFALLQNGVAAVRLGDVDRIAEGGTRLKM